MWGNLLSFLCHFNHAKCIAHRNLFKCNLNESCYILRGALSHRLVMPQFGYSTRSKNYPSLRVVNWSEEHFIYIASVFFSLSLSVADWFCVCALVA